MRPADVFCHRVDANLYPFGPLLCIRVSNYVEWLKANNRKYRVEYARMMGRVK
jgi:hypothetical protein